MDRLRTGAIATAALLLAGCASTTPVRDEPHHFSKAPDGERVACYVTDVANEYECFPVAARYPGRYAWDPFFDPWSPAVRLGVYYGWPSYWHHGGGWYPYPYPYRPHPRPHRHHR